jgi:predicted 3-demethylubiquinone-9 3-methyltransferase (glyoxalase superfamily)
MQKITPMLWYEGQAEEAAKFYCSVFPNSKMGRIARYGDHGPLPRGTVMTVAFTLDGQEFVALNGGPHDKFNDSISLVVNCDTQAEIDEMWAKLTSGGGREVQCGWLKDRYGVSWQVVPRQLPELMKDPQRANAVMHEVLKMKKLDLNRMKEAYEHG